MPLSNENMGWLSKKSDETDLALFPDHESNADHKNSWEKNSKTRSANATSVTAVPKNSSRQTTKKHSPSSFIKDTASSSQPKRHHASYAESIPRITPGVARTFRILGPLSCLAMPSFSRKRKQTTKRPAKDPEGEEEVSSMGSCSENGLL